MTKQQYKNSYTLMARNQQSSYYEKSEFLLFAPFVCLSWT